MRRGESGNETGMRRGGYEERIEECSAASDGSSGEKKEREEAAPNSPER
jgi:hypothetical protein